LYEVSSVSADLRWGVRPDKSSYKTCNAWSPGSFVGVLQFVVGGFSKQQRCLKKRISQQYPFGVIYAFNMFMFIFVNTVAIAAMVVTSIFL